MDWNSITIGQYQIIHKNKHNGIELLSIVSGKTIEEIETMPLKKSIDLANKYAFISNSDPQPLFKTKWDDYDILQIKKRGTGGEMFDFLSLIEQNKPVENMHLILATICHNRINDFEQRAEDIAERMPITIGLGITDFFFQNLTLSEKTIPFYLHWMTKGKIEPKKMKAALENYIQDLKMNTSGIYG